VMRALDVIHQRQVALKVRELHSEGERGALLEEARILLSVRPHPNLPLLREDFIVEDRYYLVMDWIEGRDLRQVLEEEGTPGLALERVLDYLGQAAEALDHLHDHDPPVVHQDVKPANLILAPDGRVVLVDFGISQRREGSGPEPRGTPDYRAPEVAGGGPTPASDIFSLAVTGYALLTGAPPRPEVKPKLRELSDDGVSVIRALRRGLAIDPSRRPASAAALVEAMRAGARGADKPRVGVSGLEPKTTGELDEPLKAAPPPRGKSRGGSSARRFAPRWAWRVGRGWGLGTIAALALLLVVTFVGLRGDAPTETITPPAPSPVIRVGEGLASCPKGYLCVWEHAGYRGGGVGIFGTEKNWAEFPEEFGLIARQGSSFYNRGIPAPRDPRPDVYVFNAPDFSGDRLCIPNGRSIESAEGSRFENAVLSNRWVDLCS
jgi:hypothetical protein